MDRADEAERALRELETTAPEHETPIPKKKPHKGVKQ
jgi:hypothetical protein